MLKLKNPYLENLNDLPTNLELLYIKRLRIKGESDLQNVKYLNLPVLLDYLIIDRIEEEFTIANSFQVDDMTLENVNYFVSNIKIPFGCKLLIKTVAYESNNCHNLMTYYMNDELNGFRICKNTVGFYSARKKFQELTKQIVSKYKK